VHFIVGGGGDGGPGIIQLHVTDLSKIKAPTSVGQNFYKILKPPPVGTDLTTINLAPPGHWGHLLPFAGILGDAPDGEPSEPATPESKLELFRVPFRF
jgi:hypothetical protein